MCYSWTFVCPVSPDSVRRSAGLNLDDVDAEDEESSPVTRRCVTRFHIGEAITVLRVKLIIGVTLLNV